MSRGALVQHYPRRSRWHGKLFFLTAIATILVLAVPAVRQPVLGVRPPATRKLILLGVTGASLVFGPVWFLLGSGDQPNIAFGETLGVSAGRTFWFRLALLACGAGVGGAGMTPGGAPPPARDA